jgi:hypothetical protein
MSDAIESSVWWDLHLRKARGATLSEAEQQFYDAELARQDREAPPLKSGLEALKQLRQQVLALGRDNAEPRTRLGELDREIDLIEQSLSEQTRQLLGVGE